MSLPWVLRHPTLRALTALSALWALSFGLTIRSSTVTARDRGVSVDAIGLIAASYLLAQIFLQARFGALSDRIGRAGLLAAGIAVFSVATASFVFADRCRSSCCSVQCRAWDSPWACRRIARWWPTSPRRTSGGVPTPPWGRPTAAGSCWTGPGRIPCWTGGSRCAVPADGGNRGRAGGRRHPLSPGRCTSGGSRRGGKTCPPVGAPDSTAPWCIPARICRSFSDGVH